MSTDQLKQELISKTKRHYNTTRIYWNLKNVMSSLPI